MMKKLNTDHFTVLRPWKDADQRLTVRYSIYYKNRMVAVCWEENNSWTVYNSSFLPLWEASGLETLQQVIEYVSSKV